MSIPGDGTKYALLMPIMNDKSSTGNTNFAPKSRFLAAPSFGRAGQHPRFCPEDENGHER
jgi:hypothetical protein